MRIAFVFAAAVLFVSSGASAVDIAMLATGATKEIVLELIPQFEKSTGHKVIATWTGTAGIRKRIGDGEIYDLVIVGAPVIDSFIAQGKVAPGSRTELMKSAVGVAVRAGAPKPDIGSSEAVKTMLLGRQVDWLLYRPKRGSCREPDWALRHYGSDKAEAQTGSDRYAHGNDHCNRRSRNRLSANQ